MRRPKSHRRQHAMAVGGEEAGEDDAQPLHAWHTDAAHRRMKKTLAQAGEAGRDTPRHLTLILLQYTAIPGSNGGNSLRFPLLHCVFGLLQQPLFDPLDILTPPWGS